MQETRNKRLSVAGTAIAAVLAHLPCCGPTLLLAIGGASTGLGWLHWLEPWRPLFLTFSFVQLAVGFWLVYRPNPHVHSDGGTCEHDHSHIIKWERVILWAVAAMVIAIALLPHHH